MIFAHFPRNGPSRTLPDRLLDPSMPWLELVALDSENEPATNLSGAF
jgi:hypothetical protein